ncbi:hypothetical protein ESY86_08790 [Subsaximicrobium wynnwilliamsii]|uniref:Lipoprotein n=1 Tax=Subsaximicrobium wynnwilliamsii TaxID=291179 RepID=A0A5C6ZLE7_9FLAO|nr:hypothetical protein [Subsaximicrobium wynnwilliamsii]TXD83648.1 hypothetical protein ESY87_08415 [Subsaximicrobium wynnwilliamsii]TXD89467.1 hypothetical protein ESY86_08790 [Subsaximicrobium wynnwilliamsii]TXE03485.1 hypothetical protein ESY88_07440 [Subsaximicrobium wynnwilliamsii]
MKNLKNLTRATLFSVCLSIPFMGLMGCSSSDDSDDINTNCGNWSDLFLSQANLYSQASQAYADDPSPANCQNFKSAGLNYIDALEGAIDCVPTANVQGFNAELDQYRAEVNALDCD